MAVHQAETTVALHVHPLQDGQQEGSSLHQQEGLFTVSPSPRLVEKILHLASS